MDLSHFHTWGLVVPLACAVSPMFLPRLALQGVPTAFNALLAGAVMGAIAWLLFKYVPVLKEKCALSKAVLCGLLVAEVMVLKTSTAVPSVAAITLWLFLYYHAVEH